MAHGYHSDRIEKIDVVPSMSISNEELQRRTQRLSSATVLRGLTGGDPRPLILDEPLAEEIIAHKDELGVSISDYIRTIYSEAVGQGAVDGYQDRLRIRVPKAEEDRRLAS